MASVIKQLKKRFTVCFRETFFTALQQEDINGLLRVSVPVQINRVIIIRYFQHAHFMPNVGMGKRGAY